MGCQRHGWAQDHPSTSPCVSVGIQTALPLRTPVHLVIIGFLAQAMLTKPPSGASGAVNPSDIHSYSQCWCPAAAWREFGSKTPWAGSQGVQSKSPHPWHPSARQMPPGKHSRRSPIPVDSSCGMLDVGCSHGLQIFELSRGKCLSKAL